MLVIQCFLIYDKRNVNYAISNNHFSETGLKINNYFFVVDS